MSDSIIVFLRNTNVPKASELVSALISEGLTLEEWEEADDLTEIRGFWPGQYYGSEAGFEFSLSEVEDDDLEGWDVEEKDLDGRDLVAELSYRTENDLVASIVCGAYLIGKCDGVTFDDNEELSVTHINSRDWVKNYL